MLKTRIIYFEQKYSKPLLIMTTMSFAFIEVMDSTIINIALPAIATNLQIDNLQASWLFTSYLIASAITMPLTGYLVNRLGRRKLLLANISLFLISSVLCGIAYNFWLILLGRIIQGMCGGTLIPLAQAILRDNFPPEKQMQANSIWGLGIMIAPIVGPLIGSTICSVLNWRWLFFINIPLGILALILCFSLIQETDKTTSKFSYVEFALFALGIGCLQLFLSLNAASMLTSHLALYSLGIALIALVFFALKITLQHSTLLNLKLFKNFNFTICSLLSASYSAALLGFLTIEPILFEELLKYSIAKTGFIFSIRGLTCFIAMILVPKLAQLMNIKLILIIGIICSAIGHLLMCLSINKPELLYFSLAFSFYGLGMGFFFIPITILAFSVIPDQSSNDAAGIYSYVRMLGTTTGIAIMSGFFFALSGGTTVIAHAMSASILSYLANEYLLFAFCILCFIPATFLIRTHLYLPEKYKAKNKSLGVE